MRAERHTEALRAADGHVHAKFARRAKQRQGQQIRGHRDQRARDMSLFDKVGVIVDLAVGVRVLNQRAENLLMKPKSLVIADDDFDP